MKEMTEEKRIEEALSSTEKYLSIKRLQDLIELHNGNTYSKKFLSLKLNSELETWKSKKSKVYAEKITATLYLNQNPLFVASGVYNREDNYFSPEQRKEKINVQCILLLLGIVKYGIDTEKETPLLILNEKI